VACIRNPQPPFQAASFYVEYESVGTAQRARVIEATSSCGQLGTLMHGNWKAANQLSTYPQRTRPCNHRFPYNLQIKAIPSAFRATNPGSTSNSHPAYTKILPSYCSNNGRSSEPFELRRKSFVSLASMWYELNAEISMSSLLPFRNPPQYVRPFQPKYMQGILSKDDKNCP
jgi:hypothetical protein